MSNLLLNILAGATGLASGYNAVDKQQADRAYAERMAEEQRKNDYQDFLRKLKTQTQYGLMNSAMDYVVNNQDKSPLSPTEQTIINEAKNIQAHRRQFETPYTGSYENDDAILKQAESLYPKMLSGNGSNNDPTNNMMMDILRNTAQATGNTGLLNILSGTGSNDSGMGQAGVTGFESQPKQIPEQSGTGIDVNIDASGLSLTGNGSTLNPDDMALVISQAEKVAGQPIVNKQQPSQQTASSSPTLGSLNAPQQQQYIHGLPNAPMINMPGADQTFDYSQQVPFEAQTSFPLLERSKLPEARPMLQELQGLENILDDKRKQREQIAQQEYRYPSMAKKTFRQNQLNALDTEINNLQADINNRYTEYVSALSDVNREMQQNRMDSISDYEPPIDAETAHKEWLKVRENTLDRVEWEWQNIENKMQDKTRADYEVFKQQRLQEAWRKFPTDMKSMFPPNRLKQYNTEYSASGDSQSMLIEPDKFINSMRQRYQGIPDDKIAKGMKLAGYDDETIKVSFGGSVPEQPKQVIHVEDVAKKEKQIDSIYASEYRNYRKRLIKEMKQNDETKNLSDAEMHEIINKFPQQNLWVTGGRGRSPRT